MMRGGCYCGRVRYEADSIFDAVYCHCSICRRISGAPVYAGTVIPMSDFRVVSGEPASFASSEHGRRWFCSVCGTQFHYTDPRSNYVGVPIGTLDEPESVAPKIHQWTSSQLTWFEIADDLPRIPDGTLPHPTKRAHEGEADD